MNLLIYGCRVEGTTNETTDGSEEDNGG